MRKKTIDMLNEYVKKHGLLKAAALFGHKDTNRVARWQKENDVPESIDGLVRSSLERSLNE